MNKNWFENNKHGRPTFLKGQEDWETVHQIAVECASFLMDDEDECVSNLNPSCYNCKYRRWTAKSFTCMK